MFHFRGCQTSGQEQNSATVIILAFILALIGCASAQTPESPPTISAPAVVSTIPRSITPVLHTRDKPIYTQDSYFRFELAGVKDGNTLRITDADKSVGERIAAAIKNYFYGHKQSLVASFTPSIGGKPMPKQVLYAWTDDGTTQTNQHGPQQLSPLFRDTGAPIPLEFGAQYTDQAHSNLVKSLFTAIQEGVNIWGSPTSLFSKISADRYKSAGEKIDAAINVAFSGKKDPIVPISVDLSNHDRIDMVSTDGDTTKTLLSILITPQDSLWATNTKNLPETPQQIETKAVDSDKTVRQLLTENSESRVRFNNAKGKGDIPAIHAFCADVVNTLADSALSPLDTAVVLYSVLFNSLWNSNPALRVGNDPCESNTKALVGTNLDGKLHPRSYLIREKKKRDIAIATMQDSVFEDIPTALQTRTAASWRALLAPSVAITVEGGSFLIGTNTTLSPDAPIILATGQAASTLAQMPVTYRAATVCFQVYAQVSTMTFFTKCIQAQDPVVAIKKVDLTFDKSFADESTSDDGDAQPLLTALRFYL